MQVSETKSEGLKRDFKIVVPADDIEQQVSSRLKEMARSAQMPGFRPGKVPLSLLRKKFGTALMGEILERTVNDSSQKALTDRGLRPAMQPHIEITSFEDGADLEYTMAVELMPQIEPIDFSGIELERLVVQVDDTAVDAALERIAEAQRTPIEVTDGRASVEGDFLVLDFVGRVDDVEFPGGKADGYVLELGSGSFIPGFEEQLVGAKVGDQVDVDVTFPEDYGAENLAGKAAVFKVDVTALREAGPAVVGDEVAKKMGLDDLDDLRRAVREDHDKEYRAMSRMRLKRSLLDALAEAHDFAVPEGMVEFEFEQIWKEVEERRAAGEELEDEDAGKSDDEMKTEFRDIAERRVRLGLVITEVGRLNNIDVTSEDLGRAMNAEARRYPGQEQAVMDHFRKNPEAAEPLRAPIFEEKVVDFILEMASVSERTVSLEELAREPDEPEPEAKPEAGKRKKAAPKKKAAEAKPATKRKPKKEA